MVGVFLVYSGEIAEFGGSLCVRGSRPEGALLCFLQEYDLIKYCTWWLSGLKPEQIGLSRTISPAFPDLDVLNRNPMEQQRTCMPFSKYNVKFCRDPGLANRLQRIDES